MRATIFTTATALLASATSAKPIGARNGVVEPYAAVNLLVKNEPISGSESSTTPLSVPFGTLVHNDNLSVTQIEVEGVTLNNLPGAPKVDNKKVACRMYKDQYGVETGSEEFSKAKAAGISTNPVELGWILCWLN